MRMALRGAQVRAAPLLRRPAFNRGAGQSDLIPATIPAPVKGWDANSPLENMDPASAIILDNFFPEPGYVRLRGGSSSHATGLGSGPVESLMAYHGPGATSKLFGARGTSVFDVSSAGAVGAAAITSTGNARFQHVHQTTSGGNFLIIVNGSIAPRSFDGSSWATPSITGITTTDVIHCNVHQRRLWLILQNSTTVAYLPVDSIAGAATTFNLGPLMSKGGNVMAMATWTRDGGSGPDDFAVFVTSKGQCIVYVGTDPASSATWALQGVYEIGAPIGRRCFTKVAGDLAIITVDGVQSLSAAISSDRTVAKRSAITGNIQDAMNKAAKTARSNYGWQAISYPLGTAFILNVPLTEGTLMHQYVMNPLTGAWCRYIGQNAVCWEIFNEVPYFGGLSGVVYKADSGGRDGTALIVGDIKTAFNHFSSRGTNKQFRMIRALMTGDGQVVPTIAVNTDYGSFPEPDVVASTQTVTGVRWNNFNWNDGSFWSGGLVNMKDWIGVENEGHCASVRMKVATQNENAASAIDLRLNGFDIKFARSVGQL